MKALRTEILKSFVGWSVPAVFSLCLICIVTIYRSHEKVMSLGKEALAQSDKDSEQVQKLGEFTKATSPIMERSMNRSLQLEKISGYKKNDILDEQTRNSWHSLSATARMEASKDLAELDRYSEDTFPLSTPIKEGLKGLLTSEMNLWENVDRYIDAKALAPKNEMSEEEAFQAFTRAFLEHSKAIGSIRALYMQTADRILTLKKDEQVRHERNMSELDQSRRDFNLAFAGLIATLSFIAIATFALFDSPLKNKLIGTRRKQRGRVKR
jgi:uncharacterized membrane protein